jgi:hypothetical protein
MADAPSRWPQFARALRKQALMDEMMEAQGVDPLAAVETPVYPETLEVVAPAGDIDVGPAATGAEVGVP